MPASTARHSRARQASYSKLLLDQIFIDLIKVNEGLYYFLDLTYKIANPRYTNGIDHKINHKILKESLNISTNKKKLAIANTTNHIIVAERTNCFLC